MSDRIVQAKIAQEVQDRQRQDGSYSPADLVDWAASHPLSALHSQFEWDDETAGYNYRIWQARQIIKTYVLLEQKDSDVEIVPVISVPSLRQGEEGSYLSRDVVAGREEYRLEIVEEIRNKLRALRDKYEPITKELNAVWKAIQKTC